LSAGKALARVWLHGTREKVLMAPSVNKTMDYDMRLAFATNIAMPTGTVAQKYAVEKEINTKLRRGSNGGGGP
jgi:hypothetical protein